ncbi:MAG: hypothetical protein EXR90_03250 [Methyloglobulus sp.]|nr:hypothetical protein [Methyloglobulus sp.]
MIFKQSSLIITLSIGLQTQSGNVNAFDLSDATSAVDQVNSVAKQLMHLSPCQLIQQQQQQYQQ